MDFSLAESTEGSSENRGPLTVPEQAAFVATTLLLADSPGMDAEAGMPVRRSKPLHPAFPAGIPRRPSNSSGICGGCP